MSIHKTVKGTELPISSIKGKPYLEVKYRLVWFREERPEWRIETELISLKPDACLAKATIKDNNGNIMSQAHKYEDVKGFSDFIEKSETGAIGRALALVGYGTQFCADELDEGNRLADAPAQPIGQRGGSDEYRVPFGKKFLGKSLKEMGVENVRSFLKYLEEEQKKSGKALSGTAKEYKEYAEPFIKDNSPNFEEALPF